MMDLITPQDFSGKAPRQSAEQRRCGVCRTRLSRYNLHPSLCHIHRPLRFGRVRGKTREEREL